MAITNLFHREVDPRITKALSDRYYGKTTIRTTSYEVTKQEDAGKYFPSLQRQAWVRIYDETGTLFLSNGDLAMRNENQKYTYPNGETVLAYRLDALITSIAGDFGTLRDFKLEFTINIRQPENQDDQFDKLFTLANNTFSVGKKICIQYGYIDNSQGYDHTVHQSPIKIEEKPGFQATDLAGIRGDVFTVVSPEFSIQSRNKVAFSISGVGPGSQIGEKDIGASFNFSNIVSQAKKKHDVYKGLENDIPVFITNYDLEDDDGRYASVTNIIDWIDFDVQSHVRKVTGKSTEVDFTTKQGTANINDSSNSKYPPPPIDPTGDYSNVGFVVFEFDEDMYNNPNQIDSGSDKSYAYYVTLQYITWLFNWALQPEPTTAQDNPFAALESMDFSQMESAYSPPKSILLTNAGTNAPQPEKPRPKPRYQYLITCDKETTKGDLKYTDRGGGGSTYLPSADPLSILFNYGNITKDPARASSYGASFAKVNYLYLLAGAAIAVIGSGGTLGLGAAVFGTAGVIVGSMAFYDSYSWVIPFTDTDDQPQVHDLSTTSPLSKSGIQNAFSMASDGKHGNLSNILINRDCLAAIFDEMGALKRTKEKESEEIQKISVDKFFKKLFDIIKFASGGNIQLKAIPDPDNIVPELNKLLIINENGPPTSGAFDIPVFNKNDGSVIEMTLRSKLPKSMQVAAATAGDSNQEDIESIPDDTKKKVGTAPSRKEKLSNALKIADAKDALVKNKFATSHVKSLSELINNFGNRENAFSKQKVTRKFTKFPLTMTLIIQGITGFKFGDTITCAMLPPKYREKISNTDNYQTDIIFTVTRIRHEFRGNGWNTVLETVMRFMPATGNKRTNYVLQNSEPSGVVL